MSNYKDPSEDKTIPDIKAQRYKAREPQSRMDTVKTEVPKEKGILKRGLAVLGLASKETLEAKKHLEQAALKERSAVEAARQRGVMGDDLIKRTREELTMELQRANAEASQLKKEAFQLQKRITFLEGQQEILRGGIEGLSRLYDERTRMYEARTREVKERTAERNVAWDEAVRAQRTAELERRVTKQSRSTAERHIPEPEKLVYLAEQRQIEMRRHQKLRELDGRPDQSKLGRSVRGSDGEIVLQPVPRKVEQALVKTEVVRARQGSDPGGGRGL